MSRASTDVIRRVFDEEGNFIEVGPWPDAPENTLELRTINDDNSDGFFGKVNVTLNPHHAHALGKALVAAAEEILSGTKK